jgi:hypothetical protein
MRTFPIVYKQLTLYTAFKGKPNTMEEAVRSLNCYFNEIRADILGEDATIEDQKKFVFTNQSYRWNAEQFILNKCRGTDQRSFKQLLFGIHETLREPIPTEDDGYHD